MLRSMRRYLPLLRTGRSLSPMDIIGTKPRSHTAMNAVTRYGHDPDAPWEFVLALLAAVEDPGVIVRPTHRVLIDGRNSSPRLVLQLLKRWFDVRAARAGGAAPGGAVHLPRRAPG